MLSTDALILAFKVNDPKLGGGGALQRAMTRHGPRLSGDP